MKLVTIMIGKYNQAQGEFVKMISPTRARLRDGKKFYEGELVINK